MESNTTFNGFYRGIVVNNIDPLENGRVRIKIYPMFQDVLDEHLPWAIYADPNMGGISNVGSINVPTLQSHVFCFFENGDHRFPVYFSAAPAIENSVPDAPALSRESGTTVTTINSNAEKSVPIASGGTWDEPDSAYAAQYPKNAVYRSKSGITIEIDDTDNNVRLHVLHPSGTREEIDNIGNRVNHTVANSYTVVAGNNNVYVKGTEKVTIDGAIDVYCKNTTNIKVDQDVNLTVGGAVVATVIGNTTITTPLATVNGNVITNGTVKLDNGTGKIVTTEHICAFTGLPHIDGSSTCSAKQ
jgi:hypothetical protein